MAQATVALANNSKPVWQILKAFGQAIVEASEIISQIEAQAPNTKAA